MSDLPKRSIVERLADRDLITEAIQKGAREAVLQHARAGNPVATLRDGKVVWLQPDEILAQLAAGANAAAPPSEDESASYHD
jgi:hypothetical protein